MKTILKVFVLVTMYKVFMSLLEYWIVSTTPDAIEYYEDDPYYKK